MNKKHLMFVLGSAFLSTFVYGEFSGSPFSRRPAGAIVGSTAEGGGVSGGVLYEDSSGNVAQDAGLTYDGTDTLTIGESSELIFDAAGDSYFNPSSGQVGIGLTSPTELLEVEGTGGTYSFAVSTGSAANIAFGVGNSGELVVQSTTGVSGQVLTSAGAAAPPTWEDAASGLTEGDAITSAAAVSMMTVDSSGNLDTATTIRADAANTVVNIGHRDNATTTGHRLGLIPAAMGTQDLIRFFNNNVGSTSLIGRVTSGALIYLEDGSASNATFGHHSDNNTGMFFPDNDKIGLSAAGTERVRINATGLKVGAAADPASTLDVAGSVQLAFTSETSTYTVTATDHYIAMDATSSILDVDLPTAASITGRSYTIKKIDSGANAVTVDPNGAETIDGSGSCVLDAQWEAITIFSDGTNWLIQSTEGTVSCS